MGWQINLVYSSKRIHYIGAKNAENEILQMARTGATRTNGFLIMAEDDREARGQIIFRNNHSSLHDRNVADAAAQSGTARRGIEKLIKMG